MQQTSLEAYRQQLPKAPTNRQIVLQVIKAAGFRGMCNREIADALGWEINRVTGRVNELVAQGLIEDGRIRRKYKSNVGAIVWVAPQPKPKQLTLI